jgi:hypothetical protein
MLVVLIIGLNSVNENEIISVRRGALLSFEFPLGLLTTVESISLSPLRHGLNFRLSSAPSFDDLKKIKLT